MFFQIILAIILIILNGFFVAAEFAIVKVRSSQIELKNKQGYKIAYIASHIIKNLDNYLAATQLGITLSSVALGFVGEQIGQNILLLLFNDIYTNVYNAIAIPMIFIIITIIHIVFGELVPKSIAIGNPTGTMLYISVPLRAFYFIFNPLIYLLNNMANIILNILNIKFKNFYNDPSFEELKIILDQSKKIGSINLEEHTLLKNVFDFKDIIVKNIMTPRTDIVAINIHDNQKTILNMILNEKYTRFPVYNGSIDNIVGILHVKDILIKVGKSQNIVLKELLRETYFVPESQKVSTIFKYIQQKKNTMMVIVLDEFGGTAGMVTLEDIVEELVGDIQDEYDNELPIVKKNNENEYIVNASSSITDVNEFLPFKLPENDEYDTVSGLMNFVFNKIPDLKEEIIIKNYKCIILTKIGRKIGSVKLLKINKS